MLCLKFNPNQFIELTDRNTGRLIGRIKMEQIGHGGTQVRLGFDLPHEIKIARRDLPPGGDLLNLAKQEVES